MNPWTSLSNIGLRSGEAPNDLRRIQLINQMCFISAGCSIVFIPYVYFVIGNCFYGTIMCYFAVLLALYGYFSSKRWFMFSLWWVIVITIINIFWGSLESPGGGIEFFFVPLSLIPFTVVENKKLCFAFVGVCAGSLVLSHFMKKVYVPHTVPSEFYNELTYMVCLVGIFILAALIISQFRIINSKFEKIINDQKQEVEQKNKEVTDSIRYAERIQRSLLPNEKYIGKNMTRLKQNQK